MSVDAYLPSDIAGFNPSHIAMAHGGKCRWSAVPVGPSGGLAYYRTLYPIADVQPDYSLSPQNPGGIDSVIGPVVLIQPNVAGGFPNAVKFTNDNLATDATITMAAMCVAYSPPGPYPSPNGILETGNGTGWGLGADNSGNLALVELVSQAISSSNIALAQNTQYFVAASYTGTAVNFVCKNLQTGSILSNTQAASFTPSPADIEYFIGVVYGHGWLYPGAVGPVAITTAALSPKELLMWAGEPRAFWYPKGLLET